MSTANDRARGARAQAAAAAETRRQALANVPYARLPESALALSDGAYRQLGALLRWCRGRGSCKVTDQDLGRLLHRCERAVQYHWHELEAAGFVERRRRYGHRTIYLRYSLAGSRQQAPTESACTRKETTAVGGQTESACTRKDVQVHSQTGASGSAPDCRFPTPLHGSNVDTTSSSDGKPGDDDDSARTPGEFEQTAQAFIRRHLAPAVAQELLDDTARIASKTNGRWDCVAAAVAMLATRRGEPLRSSVPWVIRTANDFATHGISAEAKAATAKLEARARANDQARAQAAAAQARQDQAADEPITEAEVAKYRTWAQSHDAGKAAVGRAWLQAAGLPVNPVAKENPADRISPKTPDRPVARDESTTLPDSCNFTGNADNSQDANSRTEHKSH